MHSKIPKTVHGLGINDINLSSKDPRYIIWKSMLSRCDPTYIGYRNATCCAEWVYLSNFINWLETQDWEGKQLDKDLLNPKNKEYAPSNCLFVSPEVNTAIKSKYSRKYALPSGISKCGNKFQVKCHSTWIGSFTTLNEAIDAYCISKRKVLDELANKQTDIRIKNALLNYPVRNLL